MKKKLFDIRLYRDALRQLKVIGGVAAVILMLEAVLLPVYQVIVGAPANGYLQNRDIWALHPMAVMVFAVVVPEMTLTLFRFLNSRRDSDFYHAIPQTRVCVAVSFLAAVLSWAAVLQWGSTLVSVALHMVLPTCTRILWDSLLLQSLSFTILSILIAGAVLLAMTLTGNRFSNIMTAILILWAPRAIMLVVKMGVGSSMSIISSDRYLPFLGNDYNILTGCTLGVFTNWNRFADIFMNPAAMGYTLALGLAYCGLGIISFRRRASEAAGRASVHPGLQLLLRLLPAFLYGLIPDVMLFADLSGQNEMTGEEGFTLFILYLISVLIYFLYELISTRKVRNLKKAVPGLALLLTMNVLTVAGMMGMRSSILAFRPTAEEIDSVSMSTEAVYLYADDTVISSYGSGRYDGYFTSRLAKVEITDPEVKELVARRLDAAVERERVRAASENMTMKEITIRAGRRTEVRRIAFTSRDLQMMGESLMEEPGVEDLYMELPPAEDPNLRLQVYDYRWSMNREQAREIYLALQEDVKEMGFVRWFTYLSRDYSAEDVEYQYIVDLQLIYTDHTRMTASAIPLSNLTPRAAAAYRKCQMETQQADEAVPMMLEKLEKLASASPEQRKLSRIAVYGSVQEQYGDILEEVNGEGSIEDNLETVETLIELLRRQETLSYDEAEKFWHVDVYLECMLDSRGEPASDEAMICGSEGINKYLILAVPE